MFGSLLKRDVPMVNGDNPELYESILLGDLHHKKYQMLIGMLTWIVVLRRLDVCYAVLSLSRFTACPRSGHLDRFLYKFGYLEKRPNRKFIIDSRQPIVGKNDSQHLLTIDYASTMKKIYPDAAEVIDDQLPPQIIDELKLTVYVIMSMIKIQGDESQGLLFSLGELLCIFFRNAKVLLRLQRMEPNLWHLNQQLKK